MDYANYCTEDLYYKLDEAFNELDRVTCDPKATLAQIDAAEEVVNAIYNELERRGDLYTT